MRLRPALSAAGEALVSADDQDSGQEDPDEQVLFRQKQGDKDADADPEQDKSDGSSHNGRPPFPKITY